MPIRTEPSVPLVVLALVVVLGLAWGGDAACAWLLRDRLRLRFGFPERFQTGRPAGQLLPWRDLLTSSIGSLVTNRLFGAMTPEALSFEVRSPFGRPMMRAVRIPWSSLRKNPTDGAIELLDESGVPRLKDVVGVADWKWRRELHDRISSPVR